MKYFLIHKKKLNTTPIVMDEVVFEGFDEETLVDLEELSLVEE